MFTITGDWEVPELLASQIVARREESPQERILVTCSLREQAEAIKEFLTLWDLALVSFRWPEASRE